jgi:hypothetical protein
MSFDLIGLSDSVMSECTYSYLFSPFSDGDIVILGSITIITTNYYQSAQN